MVTGCLTPAQQANAADEPVDDNSPANVVKQLSNPVADLVSWPIKREWDTGIGPEDAA